ncbi:MAG: response regulator transcription factor [Planctomycetales bacterium]|nr:response regulator transcription factor [Planctomycetales bacterium]
MYSHADLGNTDSGLLRVRIHVVDDDPASRESLYTFLQSKGFDAERFESAQDFLASVGSEEAACLITDLKMPGMNGLELQEELARRGFDFPVIVVSGYADVPSTVRAMRNGAVTLLEKPYREEDLEAAVRESVRLVRQRHERRCRQQETVNRLETLTDAEREIMELLLNGTSNKSIASQLDLGLRTVERRRHVLLEKMGVASLPELARMVAEIEICPESSGRA